LSISSKNLDIKCENINGFSGKNNNDFLRNIGGMVKKYKAFFSRRYREVLRK